MLHKILKRPVKKQNSIEVNYLLMVLIRVLKPNLYPNNLQKTKNLIWIITAT